MKEVTFIRTKLSLQFELPASKGPITYKPPTVLRAMLSPGTCWFRYRSRSSNSMTRKRIYIGGTAAIAFALLAIPLIPLFGMHNRPIPVYPNAESVEAYFLPDNEHFVFLFTTSDSVENVLSFYDDELADAAWWNAIPRFSDKPMERPSCNQNYEEADCYAWFDARLAFSKVLPTLRGDYYIDVDVLPAKSNPNSTYIRVSVSMGEPNRHGCGFCP
jgi:hypothetical protein